MGGLAQYVFLQPEDVNSQGLIEDFFFFSFLFRMGRGVSAGDREQVQVSQPVLSLSSLMKKFKKIVLAGM